ncbi:MAG: ComEC/Rec2 family competence protein [Clostridia bacterium]|nr:ComEC/Rec2 family competence protein [Clostridia bacterium]
MLKELISLFVALSLFGCTPAGLNVSSGTVRQNGNLVVRFIDVGQGDCSLITLPNGETMLVDGGDVNFADRVISAIREAGTDTLDYVIATHPHADHIGGLDDAINSFGVKRVFMPRVTHNTKAFENLLKAIDEKGLQIETAKEGVVICQDKDFSVSCLAPTLEEYDDLNNYSAVIKIEYKNTSVLLTGDAEKESQELITSDVTADVLKVSHHGSKSANKKEFIERVNPTYAVISCDGKSYNHPTNEALEVLETHNITIYRTDIDGTVIFTSDGNNFTVKTEK